MDSPIAGVSYSDNTLVQSAIVNPTPVNFGEKKYLENISTSKFANPVDSTVISEHGQKLNNYYKDLKASDNESGENGLKIAAMHFASNDNGNNFDNFIKAADGLKSTDSQYFQKLFSEAKEIKDKNLDTGKWLDTFASIDNDADKKAFIDTTEKIISMEGADAVLQKDVFNKFVSTADNLLSSVGTQDKLSEFQSMVSEKSSLSEMKSGMQSFNYNMINSK